jgi:hypothetical protein
MESGDDRDRSRRAGHLRLPVRFACAPPIVLVLGTVKTRSGPPSPQPALEPSTTPEPLRPMATSAKSANSL